jgi:hypothetical protein
LPSSTDMINAHVTIVNTLADEMKTGVHVLTPVMNREFTISAEIRGKPFLAGACASSLGRIAYMGRQGVASVQQSFVACRRMANAWHRASARPSDVDFSLCLSFWRRSTSLRQVPRSSGPSPATSSRQVCLPYLLFPSCFAKPSTQ